MSSVPIRLVAQLGQALGLTRAVETGTFEGEGARLLSMVFPKVVTIELSEEFHKKAAERLKECPNVECVLGDSRDQLPLHVWHDIPTLYYLDGHWCGGPTADSQDQCPVLEEITALGLGHPNDCVIIDDAQHFLASPPEPYDPAKWPSLAELVTALKAAFPSHHVTIVGNQFVAVPPQAKPIVDRFVRGHSQPRIRRFGRRVLGRYLLPWSPTRRVIRLALGRIRSKEAIRRCWFVD